MHAEIIAIGSELLTPFRQDTNSLFITDRLNALGVEVRRKVITGDDLPSLAAAIHCALGVDGGCELVILMGGLGPTEDDRTRDAIAAALGRRQSMDAELAEHMRKRFQQRGLQMPENNLRQTMVVEGAELLPNPKGSAPGQWLVEKGRYIILVPGPPHELKAMWDKEITPRLEKVAPGNHLVTRVLKIAGQWESYVDQIAAPIYRQYQNPQTTILAAPGEIQLHVRATGATVEAARALAGELSDKLKAALGDHVFSEHDEHMEDVIGRLLLSRGLTIATAESCTGGLIGERLTRVTGSSMYYLGGVVTYSNESKMALLDVPRRVLETDGAVSSETARIMAESVRRRFGASIGISVTGIAGPAADGTAKPVGTVFAAVADADGQRVSERLFPGDRERVRMQASQLALDMVRRRLTSLAI